MGHAVLLRASRVLLALLLTAAAARGVAGCMAVPDLQFADEDAAIAADVEKNAADASVLDDADAADGDDAEGGARSRNTCPDAAPSNVDQCCGRVRCVGKGCAPGQCDPCKRCAGSSVCCIPRVGAAASCVGNVAACK